ncbi:MAG TPA: prepilin-type N-terminal cleavage/methylation domain-containing protein [Methanosphaera sp.]|nr:prepilin-type N-terminal cleavage/methylation domain-containing protein [Methanosphaera sp.]
MNKGFTLIENIVSLAIATLVILAISADVSTVLHYFMISDKIKNKSDSYYAKVQDPNTDQKDGNYALSIDYYIGSDNIGSDKPTNKNSYKNATVNNLNLVESDSDKIDGVNIGYYNFTSNVQLTDTKKIEYTNTVQDRLNFKNAENDKGEWQESKKNTYKIGDFVTYDHRQYVLVKKVTDSWASKIPGTDNSGWQLLDMYYPKGTLQTTYLEGDIFLWDEGKETQAFVYLNNGWGWIGAYDPATHEIKTEAQKYAYEASLLHYFTEWKSKQIYLLPSWKSND